MDFFIRNRGAMVEAALRLLEAGGCVHIHACILYIFGGSITARWMMMQTRGIPHDLNNHINYACSDTLSYVTLLSQRFFALLTEACAAFDALFADQVRESPSVRERIRRNKVDRRGTDHWLIINNITQTNKPTYTKRPDRARPPAGGVLRAAGAVDRRGGPPVRRARRYVI